MTIPTAINTARLGKRWLFFGDSVTESYHQEDPEDLGNGWVRFIAETPEVRAAGVEIINRGISGNRARDLLARYEEDVLAHEPSLVSILIGVNDTLRAYAPDFPDPTTAEAFGDTLEDLVSRILGAPCGPTVVLALPFVLDVNDVRVSQHEDLDPKVQKVREVAKRHNLEVLDLSAAFAAAVKSGTSLDAVTMDGIHLTAAGNRVVANAWLDEVARA